MRERGLSVADEANYLGEYEYLTLARTRLAERSFDGVGPLLQRMLALAESQKRVGSVIEILLTQALLHQAQGEQTRALAALGRALGLAKTEGYVRIFADEGEGMRLLILDFRLQIEKQSRGQDHKLISYVEKILAAFPQPESKFKNPRHLRTTQMQASKILVDPLSERELEVLRLLRSDLSGPEIAGRLVVSLNTLRTHTKNIFNKLGVNNRRAAVRRAEELSLF